MPLFLIMGTAVAGAGLYLMRLAFFCPEVRYVSDIKPGLFHKPPFGVCGNHFCLLPKKKTKNPNPKNSVKGPASFLTTVRFHTRKSSAYDGPFSDRTSNSTGKKRDLGLFFVLNDGRNVVIRIQRLWRLTRIYDGRKSP